MNLPTDLAFVDGETILQTYLNLTIEKSKPAVARPYTNGAGPGNRYAEAALRNEVAIVAGAPNGSRNHQLHESAMKLGSLVGAGELSAAQVENALYGAAVDAGLDETEIMPTINSGMRTGMQSPRIIPDKAQGAEEYDGFGREIPEMWIMRTPLALPVLTVNGKQLAALRAETMRAMRQSIAGYPAHPPVIQFGTQLARIVEEDTEETGGVATRIALCNEHSLRHVLTLVAEWQRISVGKNEMVIATPVPPPMDVVRDIYHAPPWEGIPYCDSVKEHPVCTADGILARPGYDRTARLYLAGEVITPPMPNVSDDALRAAVRMIEEVFAEFPFVRMSDRVHAYALLLTPVLRPLIRGSVPLFITTAPTPGTGKTLLLKLAERIITGRDAAMQSLGKREEETQKVLFSVIARGAEFVIFDNATGNLDSPSLAGALTASRWSDRVLGQSTIAEFPVQSVFCISGNQLTLSEELFRRSVFLELDANMERPEDRTGWRHPNIEAWVHENRAQLLEALLIIVQAWLDRGQPQGKPVMGSFESWARIVGGVMDVAGWGEHLLKNRDAIRATKAPDKEPLREFVDAWATTYGTGVVVGVRKLFLLAANAPEVKYGTSLSIEELKEREKYQGLLADQLGGNNEDGQRRSFGKYLSRVAGQVINGYKMSDCGYSNGERRWRLDSMEIMGI